MIAKRIRMLTLATLSIISLSVLLTPFKASAISASDWQAGRIIDDSIFTNSTSMSVSDIQTFLNQKVGTTQANGSLGVCDTNGVKTSELGGGTRAQYGAAHGNPAPFTCLKDYYEVPKTTPGPTAPASNYGGQPIPAGAISAAQIIWNAAQQYNISPQILLVTLQKESIGPLVTDDWPFRSQYLYAMGAHCPDSGPGGSANCDTNYAGFSLQINESAALFRYYLDNMTQPWWPYKKLGNNTILYNPSTNCGSSNVFVQTNATAALYTYTPYQPDQAALNNMYGLGDSCSAYGNRNFWRMFNDWFGPSTSLLTGVILTNIQQPDPTPARGETVTYSFSLTNTLAAPVTLSGVGAVGRLGALNGANRDLGWQGPVTLQPNTTRQFTFTAALRDTGSMYVWPAALYQGVYTQYNNWGSTVVIHTPNFTLSQPLTASPAIVYAGQDVTFSAVLKNNEPQPISYDAIGIPVKFYNRYNYDAVWVGPGIIAPGAEITLSGTPTIDKPGPFTYWVSDYLAGAYSTIGSVKNFSSAEVSPSFSVSGLNLSSATPAQGQNLTASFMVTNNLPVGIDVDAVGVVGRLGTFTGPNRDIGWQGSVHFNAGETKTFAGFSRTITDAGTHYYWIGVLYKGSYQQFNNWGSTVVSLNPSFSVSGLNFSSTSPAQGQSLSASFMVTNNLPVGIDVDAVGVVGRLGTFTGPNRDLGWQGAVHFNPGQSLPFTESGTVTEAGTHYYWIGVLYKGDYMQYNNWGSTIISH